MLTTTLNAIHHYAPCASGWNTLLSSLNKSQADDEPLALTSILASNGIQHAIWALQAVKGYDGALRLFACFCARCSLGVFERKYPYDKRPRQAIEVAENVARGQALKVDMEAAKVGAKAAAWDIAMESGGSALSWAAARAAAGAAAKEAAKAAAWAPPWAAAEPAGYIARAAAWEKMPTWASFEKEFLSLCNLENEYGSVD